MKNKLLLLLMTLAFIKGLAWMFTIPIFQIPDEPSHFSIIQFIAENGRRPHPRRERPVSLETNKVSEIINFNWRITHPVWQGYQENWQESILSLDDQTKEQFFRNDNLTSLKRPPLYYYLATPFYLIFSHQSFLYRFFSVRFFSLIIGLLVVYLSYLIGQILFKSKPLALATASLVAFQPMFSFITSGVHYDPLAGLIVVMFTYFTLRRFLKISLILSLVGLLVKPDLIALLLSLVLFIPRKQIKLFFLSGLLIFIALAFSFPFFNQIFTHPQLSLYFDKIIYAINLNEFSSHAQFFASFVTSGKIITSIREYFSATFTANMAQIFPWYWGVFGWLEKTMPLFVYRLLKIMIIFSLFGLVKNRSLFKNKSIVFLLSLSLIHFGLVVLNDFKVFAFSGEIFGIQGRYLILLLPIHMTLLVLGLTELIAKKHHQLLAWGIVSFSLILNLIGFYSLYQYFGNVWN